VTFSNDKLARRLRRDYHLVWQNLDGEAAAGSSFAHGPKDKPGHCPRGAGDHNVQIIVLDEWGRLLNATAGFIDAAGLMSELDLAEDLHAKTRGQKSTPARSIVKKRHEAEAKRDSEAKDDPSDVFASFARQRRRKDHRFCAKHPLLRHRDFRTEDMVGRGQSFFGTSQGGIPKGRIGELPGKEMMDEEAREMIESLLERQGKGAKKDKKTAKPKKPAPRPSSRPTSRPSPGRRT
jgi:hypothetical protein